MKPVEFRGECKTPGIKHGQPTMSMSYGHESVRVWDALEIEAVKAGTIEGDVYSDGEVWADVVSLLQWRDRLANVTSSARMNERNRQFWGRRTAHGEYYQR